MLIMGCIQSAAATDGHGFFSYYFFDELANTLIFGVCTSQNAPAIQSIRCRVLTTTSHSASEIGDQRLRYNGSSQPNDKHGVPIDANGSRAGTVHRPHFRQKCSRRQLARGTTQPHNHRSLRSPQYGISPESYRRDRHANRARRGDNRRPANEELLPPPGCIHVLYDDGERPVTKAEVVPPVLGFGVSHDALVE